MVVPAAGAMAFQVTVTRPLAPSTGFPSSGAAGAACCGELAPELSSSPPSASPLFAPQVAKILGPLPLLTVEDVARYLAVAG